MRLIDAQILQFMSKTIIIIPSRLSATRLPNKPLLKIGNLSIIQHVYKRAKESKVGKVYVATGDKEIANEILNSNLNNGDTINIDYKNNDKNLTIKIVSKKESKTSK